MLAIHIWIILILNIEVYMAKDNTQMANGRHATNDI